MCLVTTWTAPKIATLDIECYKVIECRPGHDWQTPFFYMRIVPGKRYTTRRFPTVITQDKFVESGFHSFFFRTDARKEALALSRLYCYRYAFIKCKIPAGSKYWEGKFGDYPCYCSDTIIYCTDDFVKIN